MKLRNKKTGEIRKAEAREDGIYLWNDIDEIWWKYSLDLLASSWEYYVEPPEPYIEDEKIRKAVRAWADANEVTKVYVYGIGDGKEYIELYAKDDGVVDGRLRISLPTQDGVWIGEEYTIAELCGEEEE